MFITERNEVAKVMFLHLSVILFTWGYASVHAGRPLPWSRHSLEQAPPGVGIPRAGTPQEQTPQQTATAADGTHLTEIHSCFYLDSFDKIFNLKC